MFINITMACDIIFLTKTMEISKFNFRATMVQGGLFFTVLSIFIEPMKGDWWLLIQPLHVTYHFSVFFPNKNCGNNENPFWGLSGKIRPLVLSWHVTFVPGSVRCSSALCLVLICVILLSFNWFVSTNILYDTK